MRLGIEIMLVFDVNLGFPPKTHPKVQHCLQQHTNIDAEESQLISELFFDCIHLANYE